MKDKMEDGKVMEQNFRTPLHFPSGRRWTYPDMSANLFIVIHDSQLLHWQKQFSGYK
jgi:hypothetical protein